MQAEDAPQRTNLVDLDPTYRDVYGLPVPRITYKPHAYEMAARMFYLPLMKQIVRNAGAPADKVFVTPTDQQQGAAPSSRHIMGTLRMGTDPGVVENTRSHVVDPLPPSIAHDRASAHVEHGAWIAGILVTASIYFAAAKLGFVFAIVAKQVTVVWPPTGIALAALLVLGPRY